MSNSLSLNLILSLSPLPPPCLSSMCLSLLLPPLLCSYASFPSCLFMPSCSTITALSICLLSPRTVTICSHSISLPLFLPVLSFHVVSQWRNSHSISFTSFATLTLSLPPSLASWHMRLVTPLVSTTSRAVQIVTASSPSTGTTSYNSILVTSINIPVPPSAVWVFHTTTLQTCIMDLR